ncbi:hypothetical protein BKA60DRAFT_533994 [Fusarium oxysporum]|nr:hypothetical protein BKA60DRAFT_533994 [Fusarium oxysporum]
MKFSIASTLLLANGIAAMPWSSLNAKQSSSEEITLRIQVSQPSSKSTFSPNHKGVVNVHNYEVCLKVCWPEEPTCPDGWNPKKFVCYLVVTKTNFLLTGFRETETILAGPAARRLAMMMISEYQISQGLRELGYKYDMKTKRIWIASTRSPLISVEQALLQESGDSWHVRSEVRQVLALHSSFLEISGRMQLGRLGIEAKTSALGFNIGPTSSPSHYQHRQWVVGLGQFWSLEFV